MYFTGKTGMSLLMMIVGVVIIAPTLSWPFETALFPLVVGIPLFVLAGIDFCLNFFGVGETKEAFAMDYKLAESKGGKLELIRLFKIFGWIIGFPFLTVLVGFTFSVPIYVCLFQKIYGKEKWRVVIISTVVAFAAFYFLFEYLLNMPFSDGLIQIALSKMGIL